MNIVAAQRITLAHSINGGMEVQADMLYRGLADRGQRVEVITTTHPHSLREVEDGLICVHHLPHSDPRRYSLGWWRESYAKLSELVYRQRADVLLSQGAGAIGYLSRARQELGLGGVIVVHMALGASLRSQWRAARSGRGLLRFAYAVSQLPLHYRLWRRAAAAAEAIIATSHATARDVQREFGAPAGRVHVIPTGVDTAQFAPSPAARSRVRAPLGLTDKQFVAVAAARLVPEKGIQVALEALARVPEAALVIAGDGPYAAALQRQARDLGLAHRVRFLGFVARDALPDYLAAADVYLMPTLYREGFPAAIVEAMATGLPCVASNLGGIPSAITSERTGLLVPPARPDALARALLRLLRDPEWRLDLGAAARTVALEQFTVDRMVDATLAVLEQAARASRVSQPASRPAAP